MTFLLLLILGCSHPSPTDSGDPDHDTGDDTGEAGPADRFAVVGFNVEATGSEAAQLAWTVAEVAGESLWGLAEVDGTPLADQLAAAAADDGSQEFESVVGTTGYELRLAILWDTRRWDLLDSQELDDINVGGTARAPLVAHLRSRVTGRELLFMVNHLWRSEAGYRRQQAELLNEWVTEQTLPVVAVGDYNFDWAVSGGESDHDAGYDSMTSDGAWVWVRPEVLVATQCSTGYDSVLDFVFVGGDARSWAADSVVLDTDAAYCRDEAQSDHRPVHGSFDAGALQD